MTATPRLYTEGAKAKAANHDVEVFSMDDPARYGPQFHRLPFSRAVEQDLLSDYKVVVLAMSEDHVAAALQAHLATREGSEINLDDAAKIVGCWRALQNPENLDPAEQSVRPLRRAIAFTNTILASKRLDTHWPGLVEQAVSQLSLAEREGAFRCETRHVDGQHHALDRKARIEWLKGSTEGGCRILSNARCLSEGIDVPALDAVLFMSPRSSHVDIVQAVGRAMRKADGKDYGYIVLPVAVPAGVDPAAALDDNERFATVWAVLRALRSHDDRFDAEINQIDLNKTPTARVIFSGGDPGNGDPTSTLPFPPIDLPPGAIYAKIVEKCGDRKYWETWARDVAAIYSRLVTRVEGLLNDPDNEALSEWFAAFHDELKASINESIDTASAVDMMAQHIITRPVFEAVFDSYDFAAGNPVASALDLLRADFAEFGLENEVRDLERFYESVRLRARGLDNAEARQSVLMELYERFFATALKKDADRLGIVYTPVEIVDFILASADHVLRDEFGRGLTDEGVHVLDPFTGTGIFLVRLIQSALVCDADIHRKYRCELHANELVLLAYYIAAVHIEEAYRGRTDDEHEPFGGIVLTDTFNLLTDRSFPTLWLPDNSERAERQQKAPIQVIVGNPPWSAGQRSSADDNPNVDYPELEARIAESYALRTSTTNKNSLYDTYKMAMRWASDRIGDQGVVAFVTNGSWIDGNVDSGVRACLADEFSTVYVLNLRGNQRTQGERSRREGGKVFGQGSRAPVAVTVLVRNPDAAHDGCRILYRDIGNYLTREDKLAQVGDWGSIAGVTDWQEIAPDRHHDWIGQRDEAFQNFYPVGSKAAKAGKSNDSIFRHFSQGWQTVGDSYLTSFSRESCAANARAMVNAYSAAMEVRDAHPTYTIEQATRSETKAIKWSRTLLTSLRRGRVIAYSASHLRQVSYRPFAPLYVYADPRLSHLPGIARNTFPPPQRTGTVVAQTDRQTSATNRAMYLSGLGSVKPFSTIMVNTMPDLELVSKGQCFPRFRYEPRIVSSAPQDEEPPSRSPSSSPTTCQTSTSSSSASASPDGSIPPTGGIFDDVETELTPVDNITDAALAAFQAHYADDSITKDAIFDYVYGVLHAPEYRERFASDLAKDLPRVPMAPDFHAFADAGHALGELHLSYETCEEYPLRVESSAGREATPEQYRLGTRKMRLIDDGETLAVNEHVHLAGIPPEAHQYEVNGRTPLGWFIDRYHVNTDTKSGIVNDPNAWFDDPRDLVSAVRRIVHVSVRTTAIVRSLPNPLADLAN